LLLIPPPHILPPLKDILVFFCKSLLAAVPSKLELVEFL
jgi:hypothetical protein